MGQTAGFTAGSWIVRQSPSLRQELAPTFSHGKIGCRGFKGPSPSTTLDKDVVL